MLSYKPITPSQRHLCLVNKKILERDLFLHSLFCKKNHSTGRDNQGHITVYHKERGHKKLYRLIDFYYLKDIPYTLESTEYDPNRSSFINLVFYKNGLYSFIIATHGAVIGSMYTCYMTFFDFLKLGNRALLLNLPIGSIIHNIAINLTTKAQYLRSAGCSGLLLKRENDRAIIKLPSISNQTNQSNLLYCSHFGFGTLGKTSNLTYRNINLGKAGRSRWLGIKPTVRGVAMNPVDHPHGGGEGKKSKKASPTNKWASVIKHSRKFKRKKN
jgi:large subunit ribosomal protein L2